MKAIKTLLSLRVLKTIVILGLVYLFCSAASLESGSVAGLAGVLVVGQALIIDAIRDLKK